MRYLHFLGLSCLVILAAACAASQPAASVEPSAPPGAAVEPVQTGKQLLASADWRELEPASALDTRQMAYAEARKWIPMLSEEGEQFWGKETSVWLVVFRGRWGSSDPAQVNAQPYEGCLFVLFRAADGKMIATGDTLCPRQQ